ncbi:hypothetical protein [Bifidobacterium myosotis]|uniref:Uncharacterized protein n=1 Tax=Bifidobacterium myosotis TaxID=1630166 RepID=A0A5M9ZFW3_9BIFI|nr:hypothetical protein [Bifidobacterium myosotis]KAA8825377.1 hypothetical protein EMO91_12495 [Bifidobacterium myosotis]
MAPMHPIRPAGLRLAVRLLSLAVLVEAGLILSALIFQTAVDLRAPAPAAAGLALAAAWAAGALGASWIPDWPSAAWWPAWAAGAAAGGVWLHAVPAHAPAVPWAAARLGALAVENRLAASVAVFAVVYALADMLGHWALRPCPDPEALP